eukprot:TRINITY_DN8070_c0_g1_i1.p1 TRINITY_DN8070_c0_g1~~TRINITY_DN8070_c0_g1_i1.p1  ORF type:complete len:869 (-),score=121.55 TRINITY_DN8070_c0_g1_i1:1052-3658(-)
MPTGKLKVRVINGRNLLREGKPASAYVSLSSASAKVQSRTKRENANPEWNEELTLFNVPTEEGEGYQVMTHPLRIDVYDATDNTLIGNTTLDLPRLEKKVPMLCSVDVGRRAVLKLQVEAADFGSPKPLVPGGSMRVKVINAENLKEARKAAVALRIGTQAERTTVQEKSTEPAWQEEFLFKVHLKAGRSGVVVAGDPLHVELQDGDGENLGKATVVLDGMHLGEPKAEEVEVFSGKLRVEIEAVEGEFPQRSTDPVVVRMQSPPPDPYVLGPRTAELPPSVESAEPEKKEEKPVEEKKEDTRPVPQPPPPAAPAAVQPPEPIKYVPPVAEPPKPVTQPIALPKPEKPVHIRVVGMSRIRDNSNQPFDPLVSLRAGTEDYRTSHRTACTDASWDEDFVVHPVSQDAKLTVAVVDQRDNKDIGTAEVHLSSLASYVVHEVQLPVKSGVVHLQIQRGAPLPKQEIKKQLEKTELPPATTVGPSPPEKPPARIAPPKTAEYATQTIPDPLSALGPIYGTPEIPAVDLPKTMSSWVNTMLSRPLSPRFGSSGSAYPYSGGDRSPESKNEQVSPSLGTPHSKDSPSPVVQLKHATPPETEEPSPTRKWVSNQLNKQFSPSNLDNAFEFEASQSRYVSPTLRELGRKSEPAQLKVLVLRASNMAQNVTGNVGLALGNQRAQTQQPEVQGKTHVWNEKHTFQLPINGASTAPLEVVYQGNCVLVDTDNLVRGEPTNVVVPLKVGGTLQLQLLLVGCGQLSPRPLSPIANHSPLLSFERGKVSPKSSSSRYSTSPLRPRAISPARNDFTLLSSRRDSAFSVEETAGRKSLSPRQRPLELPPPPPLLPVVEYPRAPDLPPRTEYLRTVHYFRAATSF